MKVKSDADNSPFSMFATETLCYTYPKDLFHKRKMKLSHTGCGVFSTVKGACRVFR